MGYELIHHRVTQGITEFSQFEIKRIELRETLCYSVVKTHYCTVMNLFQLLITAQEQLFLPMLPDNNSRHS